MFKKMTIMLILALLVTTAWARDYGYTYHEIQVVDEIGRPVTDITNLYIYDPGTTDSSTIYMDRNRQNAITVPMTEASANTTLVDGYCYWWGPDGYDFSMTNTDGVGPEGNTGHLPRTGSDGTIVFPSYLHAISTAAYLDAESITMGTGLDWVINGGAVDDTLSFTPASDNADFIVGSVDADESASMFVYISATEGWFIDSSVPSCSWTGGALNCNVSSNHATNINTGTSTGAVNIGSGTGTGAINIGNALGGVITVDTTESIGITADTTFAVSNAADQTYTTSGSYNIVATENAAMTIYAHANGGAATDIHIFNQTGTEAAAEGEVDAAVQLKALVGGIGLYSALNDVDAIRLEATGGAAAQITIANIDGTTASAATEFDAAIQLYSKLGGIGLLSLLNADDSIRIETNGGDDENITIRSNQGTGADSITLLSDEGGIAHTATAGAVILSGVGQHAVTSTAVPDSGYGLNVGSTIAAGTQSQGSAIYAHTTLTGNIDGPTYNFGSWLDITGGTPTAGCTIIAAADIGIYESGATLASVGHMVGLQIQMQFDDTSNPAILEMMRFNVNQAGNLPDYWFGAANPDAVAFSANTDFTDTDKIGAIKIYIVGYGDCYFYIYDHPGQ